MNGDSLVKQVGLALFVVTFALSLRRYNTLRRLPRRPFTWMTLAD